MEYGFHELCNLFPGMPEADYVRLRDDIRDNGLIHSITLFEGAILDGKHRYRACRELGIEPRFTEFAGSDPVAFVKSENLTRRNLTKGQLIAAAAKLKDYYAQKAKARQACGQGGVLLQENFPEANSREPDKGQARDQAAATFGVSGRSVDTFIEVTQTAIPAVVAAVEGGTMSLCEAKSIARARPAIQEKIVALPDSKARKNKLRQHQNRSQGRKAREKAPPPGPNGTPLVLYVMGRLENIHQNRLETGLSPGDYAKRFMEEFNWQAPELVSWMEALADEVEAVSMLLTMFKGASKRRA